MLNNSMTKDHLFIHKVDKTSNHIARKTEVKSVANTSIINQSIYDCSYTRINYKSQYYNAPYSTSKRG